jgi:hypothetical protein
MSASEHPGINAKGYNGAGDFGKQGRLMYLFHRNNPAIDYRPVSRKDFKKAGQYFIDRAKSIYQVRIHGEWNRSEIAQRIRKLFEKLELGSLT